MLHFLYHKGKNTKLEKEKGEMRILGKAIVVDPYGFSILEELRGKRITIYVNDGHSSFKQYWAIQRPGSKPPLRIDQDFLYYYPKSFKMITIDSDSTLDDILGLYGEE